MAWLAVDGDGEEYLFSTVPVRNYNHGCWCSSDIYGSLIQLNPGSIEKFIGKELTWDDEPVEI